MNKHLLCLIGFVSIFFTPPAAGQNLRLITRYYDGGGYSKLECRPKRHNTAYVCLDNKIYSVKNIDQSRKIQLKSIYEGEFKHITGRWGVFQCWYLEEMKIYGYDPIRNDSVYILMDQVVPVESEAAVLGRINEVNENRLRGQRKMWLISLQPRLAKGMGIASLAIFIILLIRRQKGDRSIAVSLIRLFFSLMLAWCCCYYVYKYEHPYSEPEDLYLLAVIPLGLTFFAFVTPFSKESTSSRYSSGSSSYSGYSSGYTSSNSSSTSYTSDFKPESKQEQPNSTNNDWLFKEIQDKRRREEIDRDINYYKSTGNPTYKSNIEDLKNERDRLR